MKLSSEQLFFIVLGIVSVSILIAFVWCFLATKNYNSDVSIEADNKKIEVSSHSNSNLTE